MRNTLPSKTKGYTTIHSWIIRKHGKAEKCANKKCNNKSKDYQWALKRGKKYGKDIKLYIELCRSCHRIMDFREDTRKKISIGNIRHVGCIVKNCNNCHLSKGYCSYHYNTIIRKSKRIITIISPIKCTECGISFMPTFRKNTIYCGSICRNQAAYKKQKLLRFLKSKKYGTISRS